MEFKSFTKTQVQLIEALQKGGFKCYLVGGAVRDLLRGKEPKELDFAHNAPLEFLKSVSPHRIIDDSADKHGILRFIEEEPNGQAPLVDMARLRKDLSCDGRHAEVEFADTIEEDLARRDLTINAMAIEVLPNLELGNIIDPFGGQQDLQLHRVRFVGNAADRVKEDYLRLMRAARFTALGNDWSIDEDTIIQCKELAKGICSISKERIRDELVKGIMYPKPSNMFRSMLALGILDEIFPDLVRGVGDAQNKHHRFDTVYDHLLRCLDASVTLTNNPLLRLASLCHDIAKPHTKKIINGDATFYRHEIVGASLIYNWMKDLHFPRKDCEYVSKMVRHHQWRFEDDTGDKAIRHWVQDVGKVEWRDLITLRMADRMGNAAKQEKPAITQKMKELIDRVEKMIAAGVPLFKEDLAVSGEDLIALGLKPGPIFKDIFSNLLGIMVNDPSKNNREWIIEHVTKVYLAKQKEEPYKEGS